MRRLQKYGVSCAELIALLAPLISFAGAPNVPAPPFNSINQFISTNGPICQVFRFLFFILILLAVVFIIIAAYKYLTQGADPEAVKTANRQIVYAAVAVIIALLARQIPNLALGLIGTTSTVVTC